MSDLMRVLQEADAAAIEVEKAKEEVESAKVLWELAKERFEAARATFDQSLSQADEIGIPRGKLRKLVEERTGSLLASGLMSSKCEVRAAIPKSAKPKKVKVKNEKVDDEDAQFDSVDIEDRSTDAAVAEIEL